MRAKRVEQGRQLCIIAEKNKKGMALPSHSIGLREMLLGARYRAPKL
jgi:hypothetical protein